jgi:hypothetical protein
VDGCAVHASIVGARRTVHAIGTVDDRRVDGRPVHPTRNARVNTHIGTTANARVNTHIGTNANARVDTNIGPTQTSPDPDPNADPDPDA